ncbi:MAG TPA: glycosyltransferase [Ramlibacter sp.]|nr:glycosyltransferase [Ramlibacter sp.]
MRIVIDLEAVQSPMSRNRGIGRYSMALAKGMLRQRRNHEIIVALNGMYAESLPAIYEALDGMVPHHDLRTWHASVPPRIPADAGERRAYERVRSAFFDSLDADVVHVASLFEHDPLSFTTIGAGSARHRTAVTLYDLIPHINRDVYLPSEQAARHYDDKLEHLRRADLWLAISESSRGEGIEHLSLPPGRAVNISSAADGHFVAGPVPVETEVALRAHYGLWRPFVMYMGGIDPRKNVEGLIHAWAVLPAPLRATHQLAIVCSLQPADRTRLDAVAASAGLGTGELVITGYVPEPHLVDLYRLCKLFVFPSLHEGFGLPALEAMSCGAAVIGADNSSIPEVIGRPDALFDGRSKEAIASGMQRCLQDNAFREELARYGPQQARKFSWDESARRALDAIETLEPLRHVPVAAPRERPRLAFVAPLPPARSGIADYSAELLPALASHYEIDVIVDQPEVDPSVLSGAQVRSAAWFRAHGQEYDRVLYHFGNSQFHEYMLPLLAMHPGTVVLHDFFLSGLQANRELATQQQPHWTRALYESHGWRALVRRVKATDLAEIVHEYPANFGVLRDALGVIVHSPYSMRLAGQWYGPGASDGWKLIPHLRVALPTHRDQARGELGLEPDDLLVCSFGIMGPTKMNDRLLRAWKLSALAADPNCRLVFVGENDAGDYGREVMREMPTAGGRVEITGWADPEIFRRYLNAADVAVQLRTLSRGETSGTVLDAMNHGVPVIANANGSMASLPREAVIVLDEEFSDRELVDALESLRNDRALRRRMGEAARQQIESHHSPQDCAAAYYQAVEHFSSLSYRDARAVAREVAALLGPARAHEVADPVSTAIAHDLPAAAPARQLLVDIGPFIGATGALDLPPIVPALVYERFPGWRVECVYRSDDGKWRYARRAMLHYYDCPAELMADDVLEIKRHDVWARIGDGAVLPDALPGIAEAHLESVHLPASGDARFVWPFIAGTTESPIGAHWYVDVSELVRRDWGSGIQRVVKHYLSDLLRLPPAGQTVLPVYANDDGYGYRVATGLLRRLAGVAGSLEREDDDVRIEPRAGDTFFALDLQPHFIAANAEYLAALRTSHVRVVFMVYDLLPMILPGCFLPEAAENHARWLRVVANSDVAVCISQAVATQLREWLDANVPGAPLQEIRWVHLGADLGERGSAEPFRDGAQEILKRVREHPSFLMVGTIEPRKSHAQVLDAFELLWQRGSDATLVISGRAGWMTEALVERLRSHPENGNRLLWVEEATDDLLKRLYESCSALVLASRGEGFGLPLVEAAQRGLPIIARDLPVFREVAGDHAYYFIDGDSAQVLAGSIESWLQMRKDGRHPKSSGMRWLTWAQSAAKLRQVLDTDRVGS